MSYTGAKQYFIIKYFKPVQKIVQSNYDMLITKHGNLEEFPFSILEAAPDYDFVDS
jgi:hypothetical protein